MHILVVWGVYVMSMEYEYGGFVEWYQEVNSEVLEEEILFKLRSYHPVQLSFRKYISL